MMLYWWGDEDTLTEPRLHLSQHWVSCHAPVKSAVKLSNRCQTEGVFLISQISNETRSILRFLRVTTDSQYFPGNYTTFWEVSNDSTRYKIVFLCGPWEMCLSFSAGKLRKVGMAAKGALKGIYILMSGIEPVNLFFLSLIQFKKRSIITRSVLLQYSYLFLVSIGDVWQRNKSFQILCSPSVPLILDLGQNTVVCETL